MVPWTRVTASGTAEPTDFDLLARWRGGDQGSGNLLFERHYTSVRRFFDLRLNRLSEDLTQRTFLACVEQRDRGPHTSFRAYLFGIARNQMMMSLRKEQRFDRAMRFDAEPTMLVTSLTGVFARRRDQHLLLLALVQLPPDLLQIVQLYYWETMSTAEIGEALEINASTVGTRLARARERLRTVLGSMKLTDEQRATLLDNTEALTRSLTTPPDDASR